MNRKQKMSLLTLGICTAMTATSFAADAPASQFGFSGWPYRQNSCITATAAPEYTVTPDTETCPTSKPSLCPPQLPLATPTAEPTATPTATLSQEPITTPEAVITAKPTQEDTVQPTPTATAAVKPTATPQPTAVKTPQPAETPATPTHSPTTDDDYTTGSITAQEENAFRLLNADRAANGRSALALDPTLCDLARLKSQDMNQNGYFAHTSPTYGSAANMLKTHGYSFVSVGENIAHHATVEKAQAAFMSSTGHRTNILGAQWTKVGIGVAYDSQGFVYVTQLFVR